MKPLGYGSYRLHLSFLWDGLHSNKLGMNTDGSGRPARKFRLSHLSPRMVIVSVREDFVPKNAGRPAARRSTESTTHF